MNRQVKNLQGIGNFFPGFQSRPLDPKDFCMEATGTPLQRVGFPGANKQADDSPVVTRRFILSRVSVMYDLLGLILPVVLKGRSIFQSATRRQLSWDDPVPDDLSNEWNSWQRSLCDLEHLSFPRCIIPAEYENGMFELHHFCDASTTGYGASSYLRVVSPTGGISVSLVASCRGPNASNPARGRTLPGQERPSSGRIMDAAPAKRVWHRSRSSPYHDWSWRRP